MNEATLAGLLDELEKIGAPVPLGEAGKSIASHGAGLIGSALRATGHLWGAARAGSQAAAHALEATGTRAGRAAAAGAKLAPYAGALYAGHKVLNSAPVQAVQAKLTGQPYYPGGY